MTDLPLSDKLALVTGASRGIGAATAMALAQRGAHVILTARTTAGLEEIEDRIHAAGGSATIAPMDLIDGDSINRLAAAVAERWGRLDILVLNAGMLGTLGPVPAIDPKELGRVLAVNVSAPAALIAAFDPLLRAGDGAAVIGVTSAIGAAPRAYWGAYRASKAAFDALLLTYADEMAVIGGVRVALVDPGATATKLRARAFPGEDAATVKAPDVVGEAIATLVERGFDTGHRMRVEA